eukprot:TRINITY_DN1647_c0_g1_i1.p1 TRINITY_DN1647_c0_g1~~TRINITY_DN1647_c0_g1_i1.p1  ORF type:complete len:354 (-),score=51.06 TRINITY_DN1647_c0_g1_i1:34-1053(-)
MTSYTKLDEDIAAPTHLIIISHGLLGHSGHVGEMAKAIQQGVPNAIVITPDVNARTSSFHGICVGGERLYGAIKEVLSDYPSVRKFSILGYSLGGLYARYCIGRMWEDQLLQRLEPTVYASFATPHLGSYRDDQSWSSSFLNWAGRSLLGLTGTQLMLADGPKPLLLRMTEHDSSFIAGLRCFSRHAAFANVRADRTVPYDTSAIAPGNLQQDNINYLFQPHELASYPHVKRVWSNHTSTTHQAQQPTNDPVFGESHGQIQQAMAQNLNTAVQWHKVDIELPGLHTHGMIVVRNRWVNFAGRDVLQFVVERLFDLTANSTHSTDVSLPRESEPQSVAVS